MYNLVSCSKKTSIYFTNRVSIFPPRDVLSETNKNKKHPLDLKIAYDALISQHKRLLIDFILYGHVLFIVWNYLS